MGQASTYLIIEIMPVHCSHVPVWFVLDRGVLVHDDDDLLHDCRDGIGALNLDTGI
jgi:hypothetical protein